MLAAARVLGDMEHAVVRESDQARAWGVWRARARRPRMT
jgi:hypothetical protein